MIRVSSMLVAILVALLAGAAIAGTFGVNGPSQGSDTFASPDGSGTYEISWNGDTPALFTDPMRWHPANGDPAEDLGGDPDNPIVTVQKPGGKTHRFRVTRLGNGNIMITYAYKVNGVLQNSEQRIYNQAGARIG